MEGLQRGMTLGYIPSSTACQILEDILQNCNSQFLPKFVHQNVSKIQQAKFSLTDTDTETSGIKRQKDANLLRSAIRCVQTTKQYFLLHL